MTLGTQTVTVKEVALYTVVSIIQTYHPWTPRRTSGWIVNKKNWREREAYWNFGKWFDWSLAIKRHIVMAAPFTVTTPSSVQNLMHRSSRQFNGKSRSLDDRDDIYLYVDFGQWQNRGSLHGQAVINEENGVACSNCMLSLFTYCRVVFQGFKFMYPVLSLVGVWFCIFFFKTKNHTVLRFI